MTTYKYHEFIDEYIELVESGKVQTSNDVKLLIEYVKEKIDQPNVVIDSDEIYDCVEFIQRYFPFRLMPYQKFLTSFIAGVFYDDGSLVFDEFFIEMGRGAGKNGLISSISKWLIAKQGIERYNVDIVATSEEQAKTSFIDVYDVLDTHWKKLQKHFSKTKVEIQHKKSKSTLKYRTSNAKTKDGLRPGAVIFDEIHAYETYDSIKVFTSALGKVPRPRRFYITTDGNVRGGVLDDFKEDAKMVLNGEKPNSRMFPFICKLDDENEVHDFDLWEKANPSINYPGFEDLKQQMKNEYYDMETRESLKIEFFTKRMNIPAEDAACGVAEWEKIAATNQPIPDLKGMSCVGGIDYSDIRDFVGVGLMFKFNGKRYWIHHTFINQHALKIANYKIDIELAKQKGLITIIKDEVNKPEQILAWFVEQSKKYKIENIALDLYRFNYLSTPFREAGFKMTVARSGSYTHTKLHPIVEEMFATENIVYGDDMMMRWYTNNVYVKTDLKGNKAYEKIEPMRRKTDGFMAMIHALTLDAEIRPAKRIRKGFKSVTY